MKRKCVCALASIVQEMSTFERQLVLLGAQGKYSHIEWRNRLVVVNYAGRCGTGVGHERSCPHLQHRAHTHWLFRATAFLKTTFKKMFGVEEPTFFSFSFFCFVLFLFLSRMLLLLLEVLILRHLLIGKKKLLVDKRKFSLPVKKNTYWQT